MTGAELMQRVVVTIPELAELAGISRWRMRRMLIASGAKFEAVGRSSVVCTSELERAMPRLYESLCAKSMAEQLGFEE